MAMTMVFTDKAKEALAARATRVPVKLKEPVVFYNARVPNEHFFVGAEARPHRFRNGRYEATTDVEAEAAAAALLAYGRERSARWRGDDMKEAKACKKCGFVTRNEAAWWDHQGYELH